MPYRVAMGSPDLRGQQERTVPLVQMETWDPLAQTDHQYVWRAK